MNLAGAPAASRVIVRSTDALRLSNASLALISTSEVGVHEVTVVVSVILYQLMTGIFNVGRVLMAKDCEVVAGVDFLKIVEISCLLVVHLFQVGLFTRRKDPWGLSTWSHCCKPKAIHMHQDIDLSYP